MELALLTFGVGIFNILLGYALGVYLGLAPSPAEYTNLKETWRKMTLRVKHEEEHLSTLDEAELESFVEETEEIGLEDLLEREDDDALDEIDMQVEIYEDPTEAEIGRNLSSEDIVAWDLNEKFVETSILKLNIAMMKSGKKAAGLDQELREMKGSYTAAFIQKCIDELKEDCEVYLLEQSSAAERFASQIAEYGELKSIGEEIEIANLEQASQIETTISNLSYMDLSSNLNDAGSRLVEELTKLRIARHRLRDSQEIAFMVVTRYANRVGSVDERFFNDELTKLRGRIGLEVQLDRWWKEGMHQKRKLTGILIDIDKFTEINNKYGHEQADRLLVRFAEWLKEVSGPHDVLARFSGQEFLLLCRDVGINATIKKVETLRQTAEKFEFIIDGDIVRLTIRAGISEVKPQDATEQVVFERLIEALAAAKKAGGNTCFQSDGEEVSQLEPASLTIKNKKLLVK